MIADSARPYIFKFQSDSINTGNSPIRAMISPTLNSNLILLIQGQSLLSEFPLHPFKFQSDSINTTTLEKKIQRENCFKFQSDSINTPFQFAFDGE